MGLAPQKPRLAGVKLVFLEFFVLIYKPICMDCTLLHNGGRSAVWYAYPKEERAVILRDPLLFKSPPQGAGFCGGRGVGGPGPRARSSDQLLRYATPPPWKTALFKTLQCSPLK